MKLIQAWQSWGIYIEEPFRMITKTKSKVLVIDDSLMARKLIVSYLNGDDYEIYEGKNGRDGLAVAAEVHPDLILLDFVMPGMNGYEVYQALRSQEEFEATPVIVFSSSYDEVVKKFGYPFEGFEFLHKHATNEQVLTCVKALLHPLAEELIYETSAQQVDDANFDFDGLEAVEPAPDLSTVFGSYEQSTNDISDALASLSEPIAPLTPSPQTTEVPTNPVTLAPNSEDSLLQTMAEQRETIHKMGKMVDSLMFQVQQLEARVDKYALRGQSSSPSLWTWLMVTAIMAAVVGSITGALFIRPVSIQPNDQPLPSEQILPNEQNNNLPITP
jgi:DNA-binding response OmpR family regulator